ncbi:MAG: site-specific integrase [Pseudomonadota bacterium]
MKEAQAFRAERDYAALRSPPAGRSACPDLSVSEAVNEWLRICAQTGTSRHDQPVSAYTLQNYAHRAEIIRRHPWRAPLAQLSTPDVVEFKAWLLRNCASRDQARKVLSSFQTVVKEMALRGLIAANVAAGVSIKRETRYDQTPRIPTERQVSDLLAAADRFANSKNAAVASAWERYRPMLYLAADTGMRPQEYLALPRSNLQRDGVLVDRAIERPGLKISVTKTPAGRRFLPCSPEVLEMARRHSALDLERGAWDLLFPTATGHWQSIDNWRNRGFAKACLEAGLVDGAGSEAPKPAFTPYALRHFFASMLIDRGLSLKRVQTRMGHANIETTLNTYGHLIESAELREEDEAGMLDLMET